MGRNFGRVGGASAGVIAVVFGVLEQLQKTPPPWIPIALGIVAILGVLADYLWEHRGDGGDQSPAKVKQEQKSGKKSTNNQAGRDINFNQPSKKDSR